MNKSTTKTNSNNMYHKFLNLAIAAIGFGALASCSSDDNLSKKGSGEGETSYIAITVRNVGASPATRAVGDGDFEYGSNDENAISKIRFYFFDVNGNPFTITTGTAGGGNLQTGANYIDKTSEDFTETAGTTANVEKQVVVELISNSTQAMPVSVVAVINPDNLSTPLGNNAMGISSLRDASLQTTSYANTSGETPTGFVMSNSVYDNNGTSTCAALISGTNIQTTTELAKQHPVDIYVERVAAKVRAKHNTTDWTTVEGKPAYKVGTTAGMDGVTTAEDVYAVIDGWGLADESPRASIEKNIGVAANWTTWVSTLGFEPWTSADYHRSFWEITPQPNTSAGENTYTPTNHAFSYYTKTFGTANANTAVAYTMPNTPTEAREADTETKNTVQTGRTKLLVAAHLMKKVGEDWKSADICEYKGQKYVSEDDVKKAILNENTDIWLQADGSTVRNQLSASDVSLITFDSEDGALKNYQVKATLATNLDGYTIYTSETGTETITVSQLNARLGAAPVNVRHEGMTYYYVPIRHLGASDSNLGYFGVVRNHLYDVTVDQIAGFGTPVYNPEKTIIPVVPTDEASYLSARINVLSWRIVSHHVDLNATE